MAKKKGKYWPPLQYNESNAADVLVEILSEIMSQEGVDFAFLFGEDPMAWVRAEAAFRALEYKEEADAIHQAIKERFEGD